MFRKFSELPAPVLIVGSFAAVIVLGGLLLKAPFVREPGATVVWINAFFISASAVCVTGLAPLDIGTTFNPFGEAILLLLIQVGGTGVMVLSTFVFLSLGRDVPLRQRLMVQDTFVNEQEIDLRRLVRAVLLLVITIEGICALGLTLSFHLPGTGWGRALWLGIFHSVSAFCNAGFSLFSDNLMGFARDPWVNALVMFLIVTGGLGFCVMWELVEWSRSGELRRHRFSLHSRVVLVSTAAFIIGGALLLWLLERSNPALGPTFLHRFWPALFQSVTPRTAGFNTVDLTLLSNPSVLLIILLMFIGASPGSTGGGVKTTTFSVLVFLFWSRIRGDSRVNMFRRTLPEEIAVRSIALVLATAGILFLFTLLLLWFDTSPGGESRGKFLDYLFESVSALGTVGLSLGITAKMNPVCKLLIMALMLFGRVGFLAMIYQAVESRRKFPLEYAEEGIMIG